MQPLVREDSPVVETGVAEQRSDWSRRGRLASFAMLIAALVYVAHYSHDSVEVVQGSARYLVAWLLLASGIAVVSYPSVRWTDRCVDGLCIGFALCMTLSLWAQANQVNLRLGTNELGWWWATAALIPLVRRVAADTESAWFLFRLGLAVTVAQATIGWYQKLIDLPNWIAQYHADPDRMLRKFNIPIDQLSAMRVRFENRLFDGGPTGTFALTNSLAALLTGGVVAILACMLRGSKSWSWRWIVWTVAVSLVISILLATASRSAIAALLFVSGLIVGQRLLQSRGMIWLRQRPVALASLLFGLLGSLTLSVYAFRASEFVGQAPASLAIRINYWRASLAMLTQHPWIGIGPGQFKLVYEQFRAAESNEQVADPHQFLLQIAAAGGWPTLVIFIALLSWLIWQACIDKPNKGVVTETDRQVSVAESPAQDEPHHSTGTVAWVAVGLAMTMVWLGGIATKQLPAYESLLVGSLVAAVFIGLAWWHRKLESPDTEEGSAWFRRAAGWASVAIFVDLLASGGITVPGISVALWCWVGIAQPVQWQPAMSRWPQRVTAALVMVGLVTWYFVGIRPVEQANLAYNRYQYQAERRVSPAVAEALEACLVADPWNAGFALDLAAVYRRLGETPGANSEQWDRKWQEAEQRAVALAGQDALAMVRLGDLRLERYQQTGEKSMLQAANRWYEQATLRSPSHETYWAQWAETLRALGDPRAQEVALRALKLSEAGGYYERTFPFTIIRPAIHFGALPLSGQPGGRGKPKPLQPADEVLAPLLPPK